LMEKPELPNGMPPGPVIQAVLHESKNLELFAHLTAETVLDCVFCPFKQLASQAGL